MTDEEYPEVKKVLEAKTLYEVLCVEKECTTDQIKRGYKKLAMKVHPDRCKHPKATSAFQRISHAYQVLSDENKRADYDKYGENVPEAPNFHQYNYQGNYPGGTYYRFTDEISPEDIFNMFFGNMNPGGFQYRTYTFGEDIFAENIRQRQRQQRQWQQEEANLPFYKRQSFLRALLYLIPILLMLFSNAFSNDTDSNRIEWEKHITFNVQSDSPSYIVMKTYKHKIQFGLSRTWLRVISQRHGIRLDKYFYDQARDQADLIFERQLRQKCHEETIRRLADRPNCELMNQYHIN